MKVPIKKLIPQRVINLGYHLPKAILANTIHGFPAQKNLPAGRQVKIIGVTGTDGKTTTVNMIYHILNSMGKNVSMVSTVHAAIGNQKIDTGAHVSSPDAFDLQKLIKKAVKSGSKYLILEVTSHGLDQFRFWGINFDIGVVTNVTHEHLDYHKSFKNYLKTKSGLIKNSKTAILNIDDKNYKFLSEKSPGKVSSFGLSENAEINPQKYPLNLTIPGDFNKLNALAATAVCLNLGIKLRIIQKAFTTFSAPTGRMEKVINKKGINILIDFAHTPNGLENVLKTLKQESKGSIISIIGAEGQRDIQKRPLLGNIAKNYSDKVIITAVDPRGELAKINQQILEGAEKAGGKNQEDIFVIDDRKEAIKYAINVLAKKGDIVGIFGKGHEQTMNLDGKKEVSWSDHLAVEQILNG